MAFSMTGFGRGEASSANRKFVVEIRSVNHRYCDISIKMPRAFANLEERLRGLITGKINRGKVDVFVNYDEYGERECAVKTDIGLAEAYMDAAAALKSRFGLCDEISISTLLRLPGIFQTADVPADETEIWELLSKASAAALDSLLAMRAREGGKLIADISQKLAAIAALLERVEARAPSVTAEYRDRLNARLSELLGQNVPDENRIAAEIALFADKCSIDEEIIRFKSHLQQAERCCALGEPVGRKFDFILQEINREVNTIGSKANDLTIGETVVEMKSETEKIREQIQNLE